jgi:hypothetical protein
MRFSILCIGLLPLAAVQAADKKLPIETTSNELVEITATPLLDRDQIHQELGADPGAGIVVVRVQIRPVSDKPVKIDHDDFLLFSEKDGQRSQPYEPSQIAGNSSLIVTPTGARGGLGAQPSTGIWGGLGPFGGGGSAGSAGPSAPTEAKVESASTEATTNPLLAILKAKILPEKETTETVTGLLYFQIDGKVKTKDLEMRYKTPAGKLSIRFRP